MWMPLGWVSASGGVQAASFELISTTVLGSSTPSVTFNLTAGQQAAYKHLQLRIASRLDNGGGTEAQGAIRFNGDTGSNYASHWLAGFGSGTPSSTAFTSSTSMRGVDHALAAASANAYGASVIDILDAFSTTKNKTIRSMSGVSSASIFLISGLWMSTSAISSITIQGPTDQTWQMVAGSRFSLYGVRG